MAQTSMPMPWLRQLLCAPKGWPFRHFKKKRVRRAWLSHQHKIWTLWQAIQPQPKDPGWLFWVNKRAKILEGYFVYEKHPNSPVFIFSFPLTAFSGTLGPKNREGDGQIPEGWFKVIRLNPESKFHLSMRLDYPRPEDVARAHPAPAGSDIYIHGGASSTGCVAVGDAAAEWLYLLAFWQMCRQRAPLRVGIFSKAAPYHARRKKSK